MVAFQAIDAGFESRRGYKVNAGSSPVDATKWFAWSPALTYTGTSQAVATSTPRPPTGTEA